MENKREGGGEGVGGVKWAHTAVLGFSQSEETEEVSPKYPKVETEEVSPKYPKVALWPKNTDVVWPDNTVCSLELQVSLGQKKGNWGKDKITEICTVKLSWLNREKCWVPVLTGQIASAFRVEKVF